MALLPSSSKRDLAARDSFRAARERRLAASIRWRYSLLFIAAVIAIALVRFTDLGPDGADTRILAFRVTDGATGAPLTGARVELGGVAAATDGAGIARFRTGWQSQPIVVSMTGYVEIASQITKSSATDQSFALVPAESGFSVRPRATHFISPL